MRRRPKCQPGTVKREGTPGEGLGWDVQTFGPFLGLAPAADACQLIDPETAAGFARPTHDVLSPHPFLPHRHEDLCGLVGTHQHNSLTLKCKVKFGAWNVSALSTERTRLSRLSTCLRLEKLDACFLTETRLHDDILLAPLLDHGWHILHPPRRNPNNGGVGMLLDSRWNEPELVPTSSEDILCAKVTHPNLHTEYHLIGVYIPFSSADQHADAIFAEIERLCSSLTNPIIAGDFNAHLPPRDEWWSANSRAPELMTVAPRARPPVQQADNHRGRLLLRLMESQFLISTNGRKDGSHRQPALAFTYRNEPLGHRSMIDYFLMPLHLYECCTSHFNLFLHNKTIATTHALMSVTLRDDLRQPAPEPRPLRPPAPLPPPIPATQRRVNPYRNTRAKPASKPDSTQYSVPGNAPPGEDVTESSSSESDADYTEPALESAASPPEHPQQRKRSR